MEKESVFKPQPESVEVTTCEEFKTALEGWMCLDGLDYCPECWEEIKEKIKEKSKKVGIEKSDDKIADDLKNDASPVVELSDYRRIADGWWIECNNCSRNVFRPKPKEEETKE